MGRSVALRCVRVLPMLWCIPYICNALLRCAWPTHAHSRALICPKAPARLLDAPDICGPTLMYPVCVRVCVCVCARVRACARACTPVCVYGRGLACG